MCAAAARTAAATVKPFGRASPASAASVPAHSQRPSSTAYSAQAANAVSTGSVYAIDSTTECGSRPHSSTSAVPTARPCRRAPIAYTPHTAAAAAGQETSRPAVPPLSGVSAVTTRTRAG